MQFPQSSKVDVQGVSGHSQIANMIFRCHVPAKVPRPSSERTVSPRQARIHFILKAELTSRQANLLCQSEVRDGGFGLE